MAAKKIEEVKKEAEIIEEAKELVPDAEENTAEVTEEEQESKGKKFWAGVKKHGKRAFVGTLAVIGGVTVVAKILSGKQVESEDAEESSEDVAEVEEI